MYKAIKQFTDLQDNGHRYNPGDIYPREGLEVSKARITELSTDRNRRHEPMIEAVKEPVAEEPAKKPTRKRTKKSAD